MSLLLHLVCHKCEKDRLYKITIKLEATSADIQFASCSCVAGKGPKTSCKHIAVLCYALEDFMRIFMDDTKPEALSCTDKLMDWNKPKKRMLSPKRLSELVFSVEQKEPRKNSCNLQGLLTKSEEKIIQSNIEAIDYFKNDFKNYQQRQQKRRISLLTVLGHKHQEYNNAVLLISKSDCTEPSTYTPINREA